MDCLSCAEHEIARSAVALCLLCGSGTCFNHRTGYDITLYAEQPGGMVPLHVPEPQPLRVSLCPNCTALVASDSNDRPGGGRRSTLLNRLAQARKQVEGARATGQLAPGF